MPPDGVCTNGPKIGAVARMRILGLEFVTVIAWSLVGTLLANVFPRVPKSLFRSMPMAFRPLLTRGLCPLILFRFAQFSAGRLSFLMLLMTALLHIAAHVAVFILLAAFGDWRLAEQPEIGEGVSLAIATCVEAALSAWFIFVFLAWGPFIQSCPRVPALLKKPFILMLPAKLMTKGFTDGMVSPAVAVAMTIYPKHDIPIVPFVCGPIIGACVAGFMVERMCQPDPYPVFFQPQEQIDESRAKTA